MGRGTLPIGLSALTITGRPQDDLLTGWGRPAGEQPVELGVALGRLSVTRVRRDIPRFGGEVTDAGGRIAVHRRVVSLTGRLVSFAGGVQPGPGRPGTSLAVFVVLALRAACLQVPVAGGLIGVRRQLVAVGGDLFAVGAALVTIRARLLAVGLCLLVVSPGLVDL
jgi:hypothetical protein